VNYSCLSCRAKYVIPDSRVAAAGLEGLRVRCSRCRAIMAVTTSMGATRRPAAPKQAAPTTPMTTGVMANPFAAMALPMSMAADGSHGSQVLATSRDVTGVFVSSSSEPVPALGAQHFFAAIAGRSRGPYTAKELVMLADKGRIRAGTLVWRPGASGWKPLKQVTDFDVSWLRDAVSRRKQREQEAEDIALKRRGISPIRLERHSSSRRPLLPALPADAWDSALHDAPSAIPQLVGGAVSSQFEWRAPTPTGAEPRSRALRLALAVGVAVALGLTLAALFR
jgi:predicted Zn finger-like uncharacterized protein